MNRGPSVEPELLTEGNELPGADLSHPLPAREAYERWAAIYDQDPNPLLAREERYLSPLLMDLCDKRILDLACGTGRWLAMLMARGAKSAVGIDCSDAMLRVAACKDTITKRLTRGACETLPFRAGVFDLAICSFALGHIRDVQSMVCELARVIKPGADVFISDLHPEAYERGWRAGFRHGNHRVHIEMQPHAFEEIVEMFYSYGFACLTHAPLYLGEREKPIFAQAGKSHAFAAACQFPAVLVCHFKRLLLPTGDRRE